MAVGRLRKSQADAATGQVSLALTRFEPALVEQPSYIETAEIAPDHPALAGHFPGNPIAPGALVLAYVESAVMKAFGRGVAAILLARFHAPLKPSRTFAIRLQERDGDIIDFRVEAAGQLIAGGKLRLVAERKRDRSGVPR